MTIDDYIQRRNKIQFLAEDQGEEEAQKCWIELGVANRHIERVVNGTLSLEQVETEIQACLDRAFLQISPRDGQHRAASIYSVY